MAKKSLVEALEDGDAEAAQEAAEAIVEQARAVGEYAEVTVTTEDGEQLAHAIAGTPPIEPVVCQAMGCLDPIIGLDANGWGQCAAGHSGTAVGSDFTPPPPEWLERAQSHAFLSVADYCPHSLEEVGTAVCDHDETCVWCKGSPLDHFAVGACDRHFCSCDHLGQLHRNHEQPGAVAYTICGYGDDFEDCGCDQMVCTFEGEHVVPGDVQVSLAAQEAHEEAAAEPVQAEFKGVRRDVLEGREITSRQVAFTGKAVVSWNNPQAEEWWAKARIGQGVSLEVYGELGQLAYAPEKDSEGYITGLVMGRRMKVENISWRPPATPTDGLPLFDQGLQAIVDEMERRYREPLAAFARVMEWRMARHDEDDGPAGWRTLGLTTAERIEELRTRVHMLGIEIEAAGKDPDDEDAESDRIAERAADVANFAMMVADMCLPALNLEEWVDGYLARVRGADGGTGADVAGEEADGPPAEADTVGDSPAVPPAAGG